MVISVTMCIIVISHTILHRFKSKGVQLQFVSFNHELTLYFSLFNSLFIFIYMIFIFWRIFLINHRKIHFTHSQNFYFNFTFLAFQKYGVALSALAKLQLNVIVEKNSLFKYFENISQDKIYYPFAWLQEGVIEPSDVSRSLKLMRKLKWLNDSNLKNID